MSDIISEMLLRQSDMNANMRPRNTYQYQGLSNLGQSTELNMPQFKGISSEEVNNLKAIADEMKRKKDAAAAEKGGKLPEDVPGIPSTTAKPNKTFVEDKNKPKPKLGLLGKGISSVFGGLFGKKRT